MNLPDIPLLVLEKVRNKWSKIEFPTDRKIGESCAMCDFMDEIDVEYGCGECPIITECSTITDRTSRTWHEDVQLFREKINAEIARRA